METTKNVSQSGIEQEIENARKVMATVGMRTAYRIDDKIQVKISKIPVLPMIIVHNQKSKSASMSSNVKYQI